MKRRFFLTEFVKSIKCRIKLIVDAPRGDAYMPSWVLFLSLIYLVTGLFLILVLDFSIMPPVIFAMAAFLVLVGSGIFLCWKNQKIQILSDDLFEYSSFFGKKTVFRFDQISRIKIKTNCIILFVGTKKLYLDAMAIVSKRLQMKIYQVICRIYIIK